METVSIYSEDYFLEHEDEIISQSRCGAAVSILTYGKEDYPCIRATPVGDSYKWLRRLETFKNEKKFRNFMEEKVEGYLKKLNNGKFDRLLAVDNTFNIISDVISDLEGDRIDEVKKAKRIAIRLRIWNLKRKIRDSDDKDYKIEKRALIVTLKEKIETLR